jgi:hypothetical protein
MPTPERDKIANNMLTLKKNKSVVTLSGSCSGTCQSAEILTLLQPQT